MRAGDLRKRVTIQERSVSQDSFGQQSMQWADLLTMWASIEALSASEMMAAQAMATSVTHKITARYRPEFAMPIRVAAMRASYGGRLFNISGAMNPDERNRTIELMAYEGLNNG